MASTSPVRNKKKPGTQETMDFFDALRAVNDGATITKLEWENRNYYARMRKGKLMINLDGWHTWIINDGDMAGTDWIAIEVQED